MCANKFVQHLTREVCSNRLIIPNLHFHQFLEQKQFYLSILYHRRKYIGLTKSRTNLAMQNDIIIILNDDEAIFV